MKDLILNKHLKNVRLSLARDVTYIPVVSLKTYKHERRKKSRGKTVKDKTYGNIREFQKGDKKRIHW